MKKFTFMIAALLATTMVDAQITLENTFNYNVCTPHESIDNNGYTMGDIFAYTDNRTLICVDALTYNEIARITIPNMKSYDLIAKNIYSTDGLIGFIASTGNNKDGGHGYVYNQNGIQLADLGEYTYVRIIKLSTGYKLVTVNYDWHWDEEQQTGISEYTTSIYSLPGNGASQDVVSPSAPRKSSARKYINKDQVMIENGDHTYTVTGQELK